MLKEFPEWNRQNIFGQAADVGWSVRSGLRSQRRPGTAAASARSREFVYILRYGQNFARQCEDQEIDGNDQREARQQKTYDVNHEHVHRNP